MARPKKKSSKASEPDGVYLLKLVLYLIVGAQWVWITSPDQSTQLPLPFGLVFGLWFATHDHFQIDRKIEYAVLLVAMLVGFWSQTGVFLTLLR